MSCNIVDHLESRRTDSLVRRYDFQSMDGFLSVETIIRNGKGQLRRQKIRKDSATAQSTPRPDSSSSNANIDNGNFADISRTDSKSDKHQQNKNSCRHGGYRNRRETFSQFEQNISAAVLDNQSSLCSRRISGHHGCVNAVEFSVGNGEQLLASGGDDRRVLMWKVNDLLFGNTPKPTVLTTCHEANIFCLAFNSDSTQLLSSGNDRSVILHDLETRGVVDVWNVEEAVYSVSMNPESDSMFLTASEDGKLILFDIRAPHGQERTTIASSLSPFQSACHNPSEPCLIASANPHAGAQLWDVRFPNKCLLLYNGLQGSNTGAMSARWDTLGKRLVVIRRRSFPLLYTAEYAEPICYFDHPGYYNSCTMKSCSFGGVDDSYVLSGSDDFTVYGWKIPPYSPKGVHTSPKSVKCVKKASLVLKGHRSIVNQVRYSPVNQMIASSGVEKVVMLWSPWETKYFKDASKFRSSVSRRLYTKNECAEMGNLAFPDRRHNRGEEEDVRMMAFFDFLVRREVEKADSSSEESSEESVNASPVPISEIHVIEESAESESNSSVSSSSSDDFFQNRDPRKKRTKEDGYGGSESAPEFEETPDSEILDPTMLIIQKRMRQKCQLKKRGRYLSEPCGHSNDRERDIDVAGTSTTPPVSISEAEKRISLAGGSGKRCQSLRQKRLRELRGEEVLGLLEDSISSSSLSPSSSAQEGENPPVSMPTGNSSSSFNNEPFPSTSEDIVSNTINNNLLISTGHSKSGINIPNNSSASSSNRSSDTNKEAKTKETEKTVFKPATFQRQQRKRQYRKNKSSDSDSG